MVCHPPSLPETLDLLKFQGFEDDMSRDSQANPSLRPTAGQVLRPRQSQQNALNLPSIGRSENLKKTEKRSVLEV